MALPKLVTPEFETVIPSTKQTIQYRPFLVREEKVLMIALESGEQKDIVRATKNILEACILTPGIEIDKLSSYDYEYLFLMLRSKSVGEEVQFRITHNNSECKEFTNIKINLNDIKVEHNDDINPVIELTDDIGVTMKWPSIVDIEKQTGKDNVEQTFSLIEQCVVNVFDKENVYDGFTKQELRDFIESLSQKQFEKITDYIKAMPTLKHTINWKCSHCGETEDYTIEGLNNFFG